MAAKILVIGDAMLDRYWYGDVHRISPEAPVPIVHVDREEWRLGAAANVAHNCAVLGADVTLAYAAGQDAEGLRLQDMLRDAEIIGVPHKSDRTTVKLRIIGKSQQIVRADFETNCQQIPHPLVTPDIMVISDYGKGTIQDAQAVLGFPQRVLVDTKSDDYSKFKGCYLLKQNVPEFKVSQRLTVSA